LIDAGISCRRITAGLSELGWTLGDLEGILITHTHSDHISGLQTLLKRSKAHVWASEDTARELYIRFPELQGRLKFMEPIRRYDVGDVLVTPVPTSHDAAGACGYRLDTPDGGIGILTDTGIIPEDAGEILPGVSLAVLESNHDVEMLRSGPYPQSLKARILGPYGHLSNETAAQFAVELAAAGAQTIVLAHLSRDNNTPVIAERTVARALSAAGWNPVLSVAPRDRLSMAYALSGNAVCKR